MGRQIARGLEIVREPTPIPSMSGAVVGFAKDPDRYLVELLQTPEPTTK
jgi:lactoylglutathione lyase